MVSCKQNNQENTVQDRSIQQNIEEEVIKTDKVENEKVETPTVVNINPNSDEGYENLLKYLSEENKNVFTINKAYIDYSPSHKYVFAASKAITDPDEENKKLRWWVLYDNESKKLIKKSSGLLLLGDWSWAEDKHYFYFNQGTGVERQLCFYNLKDLDEKYFYLNNVAASRSNKGFYISEDLKYIAWYYWKYIDDVTGEKTKIGAVVMNIETKKEFKSKNYINSLSEENIDSLSLEELVKANKNML